jgi:hypothetical protein
LWLKKDLLEGDILRSKDYMKKVYRNFSEFVSECSSRELEYFIFDSKFTTEFNERIKELMNEIQVQGKKSVELAIIFNTEGEIALIDSSIIGNYIGNSYAKHMEEYYKENSLNNIVKHVVNGTEKSKKDFLIISYRILYNTLNSMYFDIKYRKETLDNYAKLHNLKHCHQEDCSIVVASILIVEDICRYMSIKESTLVDAIRNAAVKRNSQDD